MQKRVAVHVTTVIVNVLSNVVVVVCEWWSYDVGGQWQERGVSPQEVMVHVYCC